MTLEDAIKHCHEKGVEQLNKKVLTVKQADECIRCADEHFQLKKWLEELKEYRTKKNN